MTIQSNIKALCPKPGRNISDSLNHSVQNSIYNEANNLLLIEESLNYLKKTKKVITLFGIVRLGNSKNNILMMLNEYCTELN